MHVDHSNPSPNKNGTSKYPFNSPVQSAFGELIFGRERLWYWRELRIYIDSTNWRDIGHVECNHIYCQTATNNKKLCRKSEISINTAHSACSILISCF